MSFPFQTIFTSALPYLEFLQQHGSETDRHRWNSVAEKIELKPEQIEVLHGFRREMRVLCLAGTWCGDCVEQCPIFQRFATETARIDLRFIDRDQDPELAAEMQLAGAARVPQVVFLSEEGAVVGRYGDRTLARYRQMGRDLSGAACSTGLVNESDTTFHGVIQDWLDEFERIQWILRTSPRLRKIHGD
ncbi:MAG: thioredoxin family protein [Mariniblastus sp.]|nr:thioredoxin family protein [Mariniblastus sp.]